MLSPVPISLPRQFNKSQRIFLTADEHYCHANIITYQDRPFKDVTEMDNKLIANHNSIVKTGDHTIHIGDFCLSNETDFINIIRRLNGHHYIMDGSHDRVLEHYYKNENKPKDIEDKLTLLPKLFEFKYAGQKITLCHYAMTKWWASHHGSLHFFGHSHGKYEHPGRAVDVGVDVRDYLPIQLEQAIKLVQKKPTIENHPRK